MTLDLVDYEDRAREAVKLFWGNRAAAIEKQIALGKVDAGARGAVTAGKNMDGFLALVLALIERNGLAMADIHVQRRMLTLPGYFRPTKLWDMLVMYRGQLVAALEFKSQVGPSFGNNFNNRAEEAIGTAHDLWTAYREGALGKDSPRPFLGWLMLLEDCAESRAPVREASPHFPIFPEFRSASYAARYDIMCRKLVQEGLYTSATFLASPRTADADGAYGHLSDLTSLKTFVTAFAGHIAAVAALHDRPAAT
jgi:hypothetical protein